MQSEAERIAAKLFPLKVECVIGWDGPPGAAYNAISEDLCESGLLNRDWTLSPLGEQVREALMRQPVR